MMAMVVTVVMIHADGSTKKMEGGEGKKKQPTCENCPFRKVFVEKNEISSYSVFIKGRNP